MDAGSASPCPVCRSGPARPLARAGRFRFLACASCGVQRCHPLPSEQELARVYHEFDSGRVVEEEFEAYRFLARAILARRLESPSRASPATERPRFLDVGCGAGHFVQAALDLGYDAHGLELDAKAVARARARGLASVQPGTIEQARFRSGSFDSILLFHVLEHVLNPRSLLERVRSLLRPAGTLLLDVPNQDSRMARFKIAIRRVGLERGEYGYLQPPAHLYAFTPTSLQRLLPALGFNVQRLDYTSPLDPTGFPTTARYYATARARLVQALYRILGTGSYLSLTARAEEPAPRSSTRSPDAP